MLFNKVIHARVLHIHNELFKNPEQDEITHIDHVTALENNKHIKMGKVVGFIHFGEQCPAMDSWSCEKVSQLTY